MKTKVMESGKLFLSGVAESLMWWKTAWRSRSFKMILFRVAPLYALSAFWGALVWYHLQPAAQLVWTVLWVYPVYIIAAGVQTKAFLELNATGGDESTSRTWSVIVSEMAMGYVLSVAMVVQTVIIEFMVTEFCVRFALPDVSSVVGFVSVAFSCSFASWELRGISSSGRRNKPLTLPQRTHYVEKHWEYACGYGLGTSVAFQLLPSTLALLFYQLSVLVLQLHWLRVAPLKNTSSTSSTPKRVFFFAELATIKLCNTIL